MGAGQSVIQDDGLLGDLSSTLQSLQVRTPLREPFHPVREAQTGICCRIPRVQLKSFLEHLPRLEIRLSRRTNEELQSAQKIIVGLQVIGGSSLKLCLLF